MAPKEAKEFVENLRKKYPEPIAMYLGNEDKVSPQAYCVGGAICRSRLYWFQRIIGWWSGYNACGTEMTFPLITQLANTLRDLNKALDKNVAGDFAAKIIMRNDANNYGASWDYAEEALCYPYKGLYEEDDEYGRTKICNREDTGKIQKICC